MRTYLGTPDSGYAVQMPFLKYLRTVWSAALVATWRFTIQHSPLSLTRVAVVATLSVGSLLCFHPWLIQRGLLGDDAVTEWLVWTIAAILATMATFAAVLIFQGLVWQPYRLWWQANQTALDLAQEKSNREAQPVADWPVKALLDHLLQLNDEYPYNADYFEACEEVRDACASGELMIWGRQSKRVETGEYLAVGARERIKPGYWSTAEIYSLSFDGSVPECQQRTEPVGLVKKSKVTVYTQLQVSKAQALLKWPERLPSKNAA